MATHSSILAWKIPWTEEPDRAAVHGVSKSRTRLSNFTFFHFMIKLGEGQGSLACCRPWDRRVGHDKRLNNNTFRMLKS